MERNTLAPISSPQHTGINGSELELYNPNTVTVSEQEATTLRSQIPGIIEELEDIDRELELLQDQHAAKKARLSSVLIAIAPIKTLTPDILSRIFGCCSLSPIRIPFDLKKTQTPWTLRHVCSSWRKIALRCPNLWSNLEIHCFYHATDFLMTNETYNREEGWSWSNIWGTRLFAARSLLRPVKDASISIALHLKSKRQEVLSEEIRQTLKHLFAYYPRQTRNFTLVAPVWAIPKFLEFPPEFLKTVQRLDLRCSGYHEDDPRICEVQVSEMLSKAQSLKEIHVHGHGDLLSAMLVQEPPWNKLTKLVFREENSRLGPGWMRLLEVLERCINLEDCTVQLRAAMLMEIKDTTRITIPRLRKLTLSARNPGVLNTLLLPSLAYLDISLGSGFPAAWLYDLIQKSSCRLTTLIDRPEEEQNPISVFDFTQSLKGLKDVETFETVTSLTMQEIQNIARGKLLPNLMNLKFRCQLPEMSVLDAFASDNTRFTRLRSVQADVVYQRSSELCDDSDSEAEVMVAIPAEKDKERKERNLEIQKIQQSREEVEKRCESFVDDHGIDMQINYFDECALPYTTRGRCS